MIPLLRALLADVAQVVLDAGDWVLCRLSNKLGDADE